MVQENALARSTLLRGIGQAKHKGGMASRLKRCSLVDSVQQVVAEYKLCQSVLEMSTMDPLTCLSQTGQASLHDILQAEQLATSTLRRRGHVNKTFLRDKSQMKTGTKKLRPKSIAVDGGNDIFREKTQLLTNNNNNNINRWERRKSISTPSVKFCGKNKIEGTLQSRHSGKRVSDEEAIQGKEDSDLTLQAKTIAQTQPQTKLLERRKTIAVVDGDNQKSDKSSQLRRRHSDRALYKSHCLPAHFNFAQANCLPAQSTDLQDNENHAKGRIGQKKAMDDGKQDNTTYSALGEGKYGTRNPDKLQDINHGNVSERVECKNQTSKGKPRKDAKKKKERRKTLSILPIYNFNGSNDTTEGHQQTRSSEKAMPYIGKGAEPENTPPTHVKREYDNNKKR